jgi:hypothetical protein
VDFFATIPAGADTPALALYAGNPAADGAATMERSALNLRRTAAVWVDRRVLDAADALDALDADGVDALDALGALDAHPAQHPTVAQPRM